MSMIDDNVILEKILNSAPDTYIIFFKKTCPFCIRTLDKLRKSKLNYKGYNIDSINGKTPRLLDLFIKHKDKINYDPNHSTIPIIFFNKKFIGGYDKLIEHINN